MTTPTERTRAVIPIRKYEAYRPSNGSEGAWFWARWCEKCDRDANMNGSKDFDDCDESELCDIIADSLVYDENDPRYPKEWVIGESGPMCSAFVAVGGRVIRCEHTQDMFR